MVSVSAFGIQNQFILDTPNLKLGIDHPTQRVQEQDIFYYKKWPRCQGQNDQIPFHGKYLFLLKRKLEWYVVGKILRLTISREIIFCAKLPLNLFVGDFVKFLLSMLESTHLSEVSSYMINYQGNISLIVCTWCIYQNGFYF